MLKLMITDQTIKKNKREEFVPKNFGMDVKKKKNGSCRHHSQPSQEWQLGTPTLLDYHSRNVKILPPEMIHYCTLYVQLLLAIIPLIKVKLKKRN